MNNATKNKAIALIALWQQNVLKYEKGVDEEIRTLKSFLDLKKDHYSKLESEVNELFDKVMKILRSNR